MNLKNVVLLTLRSLTDENFKINLRLLHTLFTVDENEVRKLRNYLLNLQEVNKFLNIIKLGYPTNWKFFCKHCRKRGFSEDILQNFKLK